MEFKKLTEPDQVLVTAAINAFIAPQDGMWEAFRSMAEQWLITCDGEPCGYACVNSDNELIQFFITPEYRNEEICREFILQQNIKTAIAGTNNPGFFNLVLPLQSDVKLHTFLFTHPGGALKAEMDSQISLAGQEDLEKLVAAYHAATHAPEGWLISYLGNLINRNELFYLETDGQIVGGCEVRKSDTNTLVADVGMVVNPEFRKQGWGTALLKFAAMQAARRGRQPICSCEAGNTGSRKAIERSGFYSEHSLYRIALG